MNLENPSKSNPLEVQNYSQVNQDVSNSRKIDRFCYRLIVSSLSGAILTTLVGGLILSILNKPIPELLIVIGSNAIGAVSGLLAPSPDER
ncbi:hypothetical protein [Lyngbya sp. PCC 8106]|uniref:hypothetical protein n=1 Tax=Lyngbya sp. (strain PCC 8106) TaxID=313612 RepID=UPI0000EAB5FB|nr:hypothetical protein [Lyngbya sp. PCC 8106]EAW35984.1 hypothetical protein L8106_22351 [Lyngbya sp. PCC 8106]